MMPNTPQFTRGYSAALVSAAILSTTAILIRYLTQSYGLPALILACWRDLIVFFTLLPVLAFSRGRRMQVAGRDLSYLVAFGLIMAVFNSLWTLSVAFNGAAVATVLAYSSAGFTAILGRWLLKERLDWAKWLAVTVSLGGCVLVSGMLDIGVWPVNLTGMITGILSGLGYAIYTLMGRSASQRGLNPWTTLVYTFGFASLFLLGFNLFGGDFLPGAATQASDFFWLGNSWFAWGVLILLSAGPTLAGFGMYNVALTHLPSSVVNLIATTEPVFTAVIAFFFLGERLTWVQVGGSVLVLGGVVLLRLYEGWMAGRTKQEYVS